MYTNTSAFISSPSLILGQLALPRRREQAFLHAAKLSKSSSRRHRLPFAPRMLLVDHVHNMPELVSHIIVTCGIGLAGIVGAKATEEVRALTSGDRRADYFDALARDVDSVRRRQELSAAAGDRDWNDVAVDKFSNVLVIPEEVPEFESYDDLRAFDRLLHESPASKRAMRQGDVASTFEHHLPDASEFEWEEDNNER